MTYSPSNEEFTGTHYKHMVNATRLQELAKRPKNVFKKALIRIFTTNEDLFYHTVNDVNALQ